MPSTVEVQGQSSQDLRSAYLQQHVLPFASQLFERDDEILSVLVVVAQRPLDGIDDAVEITLLHPGRLSHLARVHGRQPLLRLRTPPAR